MKEYYWLLLLILLVLLPAVIFLTTIKFRKPTLAKQDQVFLQGMWKDTKKKQHSAPQEAVLEAEKIVSEAMKLMGLDGSFAEQLKKNSYFFSDLSGLWQAHKLRNKIAHELGFIPSDKEVDRSLVQFHRALKDLGLRL